MIKNINLFNLFIRESLLARALEKKNRMRKKRNLMSRDAYVRFMIAPSVIEAREQKIEGLDVAGILGASEEELLAFIEGFAEKEEGVVGVRGKDVLIVTKEVYLRAILAFMKLKSARR